MNSRKILGISLGAVFALSMMIIPAFAGGHLAIVTTEVKVVDIATLELEITVVADIITDGSAGASGYGMFTDGRNNVLVLATHKGVLDHPSQTSADDPVFHAHVLDLKKKVSKDCKGFDAEVDLKKSLKTNNIGALYPVDVTGKVISVTDVPVSDLGDSGVESIASFTITGMGKDATKKLPGVPHLCLDIKSAQP